MSVRSSTCQNLDHLFRHVWLLPVLAESREEPLFGGIKKRLDAIAHFHNSRCTVAWALRPVILTITRLDKDRTVENLLKLIRLAHYLRTWQCQQIATCRSHFQRYACLF